MVKKGTICCKCGKRSDENDLACRACGCVFSIESVCYRCMYTSTLRRWRCPKCGALLLHNYPLVTAVVGTVLASALLLPIALHPEFRGARSVVAWMAYFGLLLVLWVVGVHSALANTRYEKEDKHGKASDHR
jgi:hypothetical protein